ncbi:cysteine/glutathione ABC transporter permease/ATP-binding protein CydD [Mixta theicola]|uniref:ABC-type xenobiotic transporter n=1 Tax=Mixta theicola TaxID=1458355 RepID=A0A2K1QEU4_9GAMM|nr:cysteine/glutathione ABC transporter permease/ATP-binding protein CydD [Mixta theicola]PNS13541.1 cysteine/glutathione ABC transporter permease/ATP-binding protein CydD [Mixta theicola]GLR09862.1 thiol reductant ABC exporter subunit CydD [Mixta theicola]
MEKKRQHQLTRWLRQQRLYARPWTTISTLLGLLSALLIIAQAWLLATLMHHLISEQQPRAQWLTSMFLLLLCFAARALLSWLREQAGYRAGEQIRRTLRKQVLDRLQQLGPAWVQEKPVGSWASLLLEQTEEMQDYYARYLPQMTLAVLIPGLILLVIFPVNWAAGLILLATAPLIPLFMALVGMGAADANRRNFLALARLSGDFLDRLRGLDTLRLFHRGAAETRSIAAASEDFRQRTMEVLRLAFLSSAVLEFFASISIAIVAVYFGFTYLGELNFGHYGTSVTLFAGFLALILAPEFFQPLRDLGTFYHAKAQAVGAADALHSFLSSRQEAVITEGKQALPLNQPLRIDASGLMIIAPNGTVLAGPLDFSLPPGQRVALVGQSGAGKSSLINVLLGFLPYQGSLRINGFELRDLQRHDWHRLLAWVGQNPHLPALTVRDNILNGQQVSAARLQEVLALAGVDEFISRLPLGLESETGDRAAGLSVGQAQRIAVARALLKPCQLLLLDEPGASLDARSEQHVMRALLTASHQQTTLLVTHQLNELAQWDEIWVMRDGRIIQQGSWQQLTSQAGPFAQLLTHRQGEIA